MASRLEVAKYALDITGQNPKNRIVAEPHKLHNTGVRSIIPQAGPFFTESMEIRDTESNEILVKDQQYKAIELLSRATANAGKEVCSAVIITDAGVSNQVEFTYQCVGGPFTHASQPLQTLVDNLDLGEQPVEWGSILNKPMQFPPPAHLHDIGDVYGFEDVVYALEAIRYAILVGDEASHDALRRQLEQGYAELEQLMQSHIDNVNNPHKTTKDQVDLGRVENYPPASKSVSEALSSTEHYMTPGGLGHVMDRHSESGDHDNRYVRLNSTNDGSVRILYKSDNTLDRIQIFGGGRWNTVFPAQWA